MLQVARNLSVEIPFERTDEFAGPKAEADFEKQLQEFCDFARLGFTILGQPKQRVAEVANLLRSVEDGRSADDLLKQLANGRDKAKSLLELTTAAKLRWESVVSTSGPAAVG
jgi:hypothetical protein